MSHAGHPPVIDIQALRVQIAGHCVLEIAALSIAPGERVALIGPNGAGKSTLLRVLGGFQSATATRLQVLGRELCGAGHPPLSAREWRRLRTEIGQIMQGLHAVPRLSARDNVVLGALARPGALPLWRLAMGRPPAALLEEACCALEALGLGHRLHIRADQLSGGERQKVGLARLQLQRPHLILADEPTSALDPAATDQACAALREAAQGATLVTVVHDTALVPQLADRVIGLRSGKVHFDVPTPALGAAHLSGLYAA